MVDNKGQEFREVKKEIGAVPWKQVHFQVHAQIRRRVYERVPVQVYEQVSLPFYIWKIQDRVWEVKSGEPK